MAKRDGQLNPVARRPTTSPITRRALLGAGAAGCLLSLARSAPARAVSPSAPVRLKVGCQKGPTTDELLRFFARHGVKNICGTLAGREAKGAYTVAELGKLRERCQSHGISLDMMRLHFLRPSNVDRDSRTAIVLGQSPQRDRDIEEIQTTIRNCAAAGVPALSYNLT